MKSTLQPITQDCFKEKDMFEKLKNLLIAAVGVVVVGLVTWMSMGAPDIKMEEVFAAIMLMIPMLLGN